MLKSVLFKCFVILFASSTLLGCDPNDVFKTQALRFRQAIVHQDVQAFADLMYSSDVIFKYPTAESLRPVKLQYLKIEAQEQTTSEYDRFPFKMVVKQMDAGGYSNPFYYVNLIGKKSGQVRIGLTMSVHEGAGTLPTRIGQLRMDQSVIVSMD
jgi:hypothetical protein